MFIKSTSKEIPLAIENVGGGRYILRQNIVKELDEFGEISYSYDENIVSKDALDIMQCIEEVEIKRESAIIDEYTMQLIEEGSL